jgi:hypothetical protein
LALIIWFGESKGSTIAIIDPPHFHVVIISSILHPQGLVRLLAFLAFSKNSARVGLVAVGGSWS